MFKPGYEGSKAFGCPKCSSPSQKRDKNLVDNGLDISHGRADNQLIALKIKIVKKISARVNK